LHELKHSWPFAHANLLQNVCGVSVVDDSFEKLKRFNLAEIFEPTPKEAIRDVSETLAPPTADARASTPPTTTPAAVEIP
jgi:hypothetical protein